jgi:vacuolar-type H+-ATPase subunit E/Vma4
MALENLLRILEEKGRVEIEAEREKGRAEVSRARSEAEERRRRERERRLSDEERRLRRALAPALANTRLEARRRVSRARRDLATRVLEEVGRRLPRVVSDERYRASLSQRLEECLLYAGGEPVRVRVAPGLAAILREAGSRSKNVTVESDPSLETGFQLETAGAALVVDDTLEALLARLRPELEIELFRLWDAENETHVG